HQSVSVWTFQSSILKARFKFPIWNLKPVSAHGSFQKPQSAKSRTRDANLAFQVGSPLSRQCGLPVSAHGSFQKPQSAKSRTRDANLAFQVGSPLSRQCGLLMPRAL